MHNLGKTYREVLKAPLFTQEESEALKLYLMESFDLQTDELEEILDADTASGPYCTGRYLLLEDEDDLAQMEMDTKCDSLTDSPSSGGIGLDLAMYLNKDETLAMLMLCTSNDGGDIYFVPEGLLAEFPSIHEHIFKANE